VGRLITRLAAFLFLAALVACVVADAAGWHPAVTGPSAAACFAALVACLARLRLKGGRS
jgi:hypothetical protein